MLKEQWVPICMDVIKDLKIKMLNFELQWRQLIPKKGLNVSSQNNSLYFVEEEEFRLSHYIPSFYAPRGHMEAQIYICPISSIETLFHKAFASGLQIGSICTLTVINKK